MVGAEFILCLHGSNLLKQVGEGGQPTLFGLGWLADDFNHRLKVSTGWGAGGRLGLVGICGALEFSGGDRSRDIIIAMQV